MLTPRLAPFAAIGLTAAIAVLSACAPIAAPKPGAPKVEPAATKGTSTTNPATPAPVRPTSTPTLKATPVPAATPAQKKQGFWDSVFGKKQATPAPATPTPAPVKKRTVAKVRTPKPPVTDTESTGTSPEANKVEPPKVVQTKPIEEVTPPTKADPIVKPPTIKNTRTKTDGGKVQNFPPSTDNADAEAAEKQKYEQAKAKATADPKVQELRSKADLSPSEEESRKALRVYNKAVFKRMKEIDPSIKDHVDRMEAAVMSRLGE